MKKSIYFLFSLFLFVGITACSEDDNPVAQSAANEIISFNFNSLTPPVVGEIDNIMNKVNIAVPQTTDVTNLTPTIQISPKATISPATGVAQDFENEVIYEVTSEDGTTRKYKVTVVKSS